MFYDDVQYDKRGWRNRNQIKTPRGKQRLTIPVHSRGAQTQIGPQNCCATQFGSPDDEIEIRQTSIALAFGGTTKTQDLETVGTFSTDGNGVIVHNLRINNDQTSATLSGTGTRTLFSECNTAGGCESSEGFPD